MFDISAETVTIVKSVTIRLTGEQVEQLVDALPAARGFLEPDTLPILDLLEQLNAIRNGHAADPVGATPRGRPAPPKKRSGPSPALDLAQLQELCDRDLPTAEIAAILGCHPTTVNKTIRDNGIRCARRRRRRAPLDPQPPAPSHTQEPARG